MAGSKRGSALIDWRWKCRGTDLRHHLALGYLGIEVRIKRDDVAGDLTAHLHIDNGVERARCRYTCLDLSTSYCHCFVVDRVRRMDLPYFRCATQRNDNADK